jgi:hypothetical protein
MKQRRACQPQPGGGANPTSDGWEAKIQRNQWEAGLNQCFRRGERPSETPRAHPQHSLQVDTRCGRSLGVQVVPQVDERGCLAGVRGSGQRREHRGKSPARSSPDQLNQRTAVQPAAEKVVERRHRGGMRRLACGMPPLGQQLGGSPERGFGHDAVEGKRRFRGFPDNFCACLSRAHEPSKVHFEV